jgi:hypothetical protein
MAAAGPNYGTGAAITFSTGFFAYITNIDWDGIERPVLDTTNNATTTAKTYIPGKLYDSGTMTVELLLDPSTDFTTPLTAAAGSITLTFPKLGSATTAATWVASGFMASWKATSPLEDVQTATATVKFSGAITVTAQS